MKQSRVFVAPTEEGGDSVKDQSHFPGAVRLIREWVEEDRPGEVCCLTDELHGEVLVRCTKLCGPRDRVVRCWPAAEQLIPREQELVEVTLEERAQ